MRKLMLGTASILALALGSAALDHAAAAGAPANAGARSPASVTSESSPTDDSFRKDDIRWAQVELRYRGLYKGSLDGILGSETKLALGQFQRSNGLNLTASLDARTWDALTGDHGVEQGSSTPPDSDRDGSPANSSEASDLGK